MMFPMTPMEGLVAFVVVAIGSLVQASVGFGVALIAAPCLLLIDRALVPAPMIVAGMVLAILTAYRERKSIDPKGLGSAVLGRVVGTVPAAAAVAVMADAVFDVVFAGLVMTAAVLSAFGLRVLATGKTVFVAGAISGFMATVSSIGGPPIALVYQYSAGAEIRATLSGFFIFGSVLSLGALFVVGRVSAAELALAAVLLPGVLVGFVASNWTTSLVDRGAIRPLLLGLSFAAGAVALVRALV
jgi:uncharacterized membrane protein YfcA